MRTFIIKILILLLNKLEVISLSIHDKGLEYFYVSTKTTDANDKNPWINWQQSIDTNSTDALLDERKKEGWFIKHIWHTAERGVWHTHWYLARIFLNNRQKVNEIIEYINSKWEAEKIANCPYDHEKSKLPCECGFNNK